MKKWIICFWIGIAIWAGGGAQAGQTRDGANGLERLKARSVEVSPRHTLNNGVFGEHHVIRQKDSATKRWVDVFTIQNGGKKLELAAYADSAIVEFKSKRSADEAEAYLQQKGLVIQRCMRVKTLAKPLCRLRVDWAVAQWDARAADLERDSQILKVNRDWILFNEGY